MVETIYNIEKVAAENKPVFVNVKSDEVFEGDIAKKEVTNLVEKAIKTNRKEPTATDISHHHCSEQPYRRQTTDHDIQD